MQLLIIGIDGGDRRIIDAMDMPFVRRLLGAAAHVPAVEDLWARGWAKILSGRPGEETGALYTRPVPTAHGCTATQSFGSADYARVGVTPLWQALNQQGQRVGFMNVPTTFPAPPVEGFFVAGAGGGIGADDGIPEGACYPPEIAKTLIEEGYIFDTRYMASGLREQDAFLRRLMTMTERRLSTFARLTAQHPVDVGFIGLMGLTRIQYLAMNEIEKIIEAGPQTALQQAIAALYRHCDKQLQQLVEQLRPKYVMIVSDHGQAPYTHAVDVGAFLKRHGWQLDLPSGALTARDALKQAAKTLLPKRLQQRLKRGAPGLKQAFGRPPVDFGQSRAFGMRYVSGIYLNDERFGGPVAGAVQAARLVGEIVSAFNADPEAQRHAMTAQPFRQRHQSARCADLLPDIWIDRPDNLFFEFGVGQGRSGNGALVQVNPAYPAPLSWREVTRDQWTGIKGRHPILAVSPAPAKPWPARLPHDLTAAYTIALELGRR